MTDTPEEKPIELDGVSGEPDQFPTGTVDSLDEVASAVQAIQEFGKLLSSITLYEYATSRVRCSLLKEEEYVYKEAQQKQNQRILLNRQQCQDMVDVWTRGWSEKKLRHFNQRAEKSGKPQMSDDQYQDVVRVCKESLLKLFLKARTVYKYPDFEHNHFYLLNLESVTIYLAFTVIIHVDN